VKKGAPHILAACGQNHDEIKEDVDALVGRSSPMTALLSSFSHQATSKIRRTFYLNEAQL